MAIEQRIDDLAAATLTIMGGLALTMRVIAAGHPDSEAKADLERYAAAIDETATALAAKRARR